MAQFHGLLEDKAGLGHTAFEGVYQQKDAVYHFEHPLHFAAEVGVAGGVDNIDFNALIKGGGVFSEDGDAPFPLQVVVVHDPVLDHLVFPEGAALFEHFIY